MTYEQALTVLDQACAQITANRSDHQTLSRALNTIHELIQKHNDVQEKKEDKKDGK